MQLPRFVRGQPVPIVSIPGVADEVQGIWSLWQISIAAVEWNRQRIMPLFLAGDGRVFMSTARYIWDQLLAVDPQILAIGDAGISRTVLPQLQKVAEEHGRPLYDAIMQEHRHHVLREREKAEHAFASRRKAIGRIGLPEVRSHRLNLLSQEERHFREELDQKGRVCPEMEPLLMIRVEGGGHE